MLMAERLYVAGVLQRYTVAAGHRPPEPGSYDVVIDMRRLREVRGPRA